MIAVYYSCDFERNHDYSILFGGIIMFKKAFSAFLAGVIAASAAVASAGCLTVGAGAYADIDIWNEYDILKSGKEITLTLEPQKNANTSKTIVYKLPVDENGTLYMDVSSETYYVQASFVKKQVTYNGDGSKSIRQEDVNNESITVSMTEGDCFNKYNGDVNFIWDWSSRKSAGSCEFSVEPAEYFVGFTVYYDSKGNESVSFDKLKDEFGDGNITIKITYPSSNSNNAKQSDISSLTFGKIANKAYTGKAITPAVTVKDGGKKLTEGTDYTVSYKNNTKIGTATATITGKGDYSGTKTVKFKIVPKKAKLSGSVSDTKAALSWNKSKGATGYEVYCSVDGGKFTKLKTAKALKYTAKLAKGKSYQFKVRPYTLVNGKKVYGGWSNVIKAN